MSLQQSIHLPSSQGLLFFEEKNEHPAHDKPSHILMPQVREDAGCQAPRAHEGALYPFYTPSDPLVLDEEVLVSPVHPLEWRRRCQQARMLVQHFRTPLPEQGEGIQMKRVLELGTDPHGEWLRQLASLKPTTEIIGVTSQAIYARQAAFFAAVQGCRKVSLQVCPLTRPLPFPAESMDLISGRFLHAALPEYAWPLLLDDCFRLLRPGGVLRLLECVQGASTSATAGTLCASYWHQVDRLRAAARPSLPGARTVRLSRPELLPARMEKRGFVSVEQHESLLDFSAGTPFHSTLREQADDFYQLVAPLCTRHESPLAREAYQQVYHEMQLELLEPTFRGYWHLCTIWGYKPSGRVPRTVRSMQVERPIPQSLRPCSQSCSLFIQQE
ncbi:class I SAM-dependent methyltransferase [Ktedonobacter racemifer]|uniref:Methyltransferase type 11 n=1 Tax=Ktedonobacter racemifer DSM 44963 TaxID=485913 RepID=D6TGU2_KTERA|nr:class I SAM-dependent methyltransferase [Ktedonobacter racemifer]EFH88871.1 Methyltransferase type 11 [Ktedonobacter racemifer DSM 44963]